MKTNQFKLLLMSSILIVSFCAYSNSSPVRSNKLDETEKTIQDYFKFPQVLLQNQNKQLKEYKIEVLFSTDKNGKVNFVLAKTNDPLLKAEIERQFLSLKLNKLKSEVVNAVTLNFKIV